MRIVEVKIFNEQWFFRLRPAGKWYLFPKEIETKLKMIEFFKEWRNWDVEIKQRFKKEAAIVL